MSIVLSYIVRYSILSSFPFLKDFVLAKFDIAKLDIDYVKKKIKIIINTNQID